jgi:hypothetical protein
MGLDLGQSLDYSACVVVERQDRGRQPPLYTCPLIHRWDLGTPYPAVVQALYDHLNRPELRGYCMAVDFTGCGRPVCDMLTRAGITITPVSIHGGINTSCHRGDWSVPKRTLVAILQVLLQESRLVFAAGLPLLAVLQAELVNFRQRIDPVTAHESYSAWRERDHDDLVLALALACWLGEHLGSQAPRVNISLALMPMPRQHPDGTRRPRYDRFRFAGETRDAAPEPVNWDAEKNAASRGEVDLDFPLRPEQA